MVPLAKVCEFAQKYRKSLPDFTCHQITTLNNAQVVRAEITFLQGQESYSKVSLNGKPVKTADPSIKRYFTTSGEFGSDLVSLFQAPIAAEFKFRKQGKLGPNIVLVYGFHVDAEKNTFWTLHSSSHRDVKPELAGELWVEATGARLLRLRLEPLHIPPEFNIISDTTVIDYADFSLGDLGKYVLPKSSEATVCVNVDAPASRNSRPDQGTLVVCYHNTAVFQNCHKFAANTRVVTEEP